MAQLNFLIPCAASASSRRKSGEKDVFVHASALESSGVSALKEGDKVSFEIEDDRRGRGKQAANIALS
jgi:cold shock protein